MELVKDADALASQAGLHRFVITLSSHDGRAMEVRSCEAIGPYHRNRFTFPMKVGVDDVFVPHVALGVLDCLSALSDQTEVVSLPSMAIEVPGLSLAMPHIITAKAEDGSMSVILRFKMLLGAVNFAFRPELGIEASVADHSSHTSALVLADLVMPLLDLCTVASAGRGAHTPEVERFMETLAARSEEIRFQSELIKRFVAGVENVPRKFPRGGAMPQPPRLVSPGQDH